MYEHAKKLIGTRLRIYIAINFQVSSSVVCRSLVVNGITLINLIVTLFDYILRSL